MTRKITHILSALTMSMTVFIGMHGLAQASTPSKLTFKLEAKLLTSSIHVGNEIDVQVTLTNLTDQKAYAGFTKGFSYSLELINENGIDNGWEASGGIDSPSEESNVIHMGGGPSKEGFWPKSSETFIMHYKPRKGYPQRGTYKLRIYRYDILAQQNVYSNATILTVSQ